ncbi:MAG: YopX family protein [Acutalibacteraceae bacterium]|nr:YopX family protein [Acutalibacteraceae bacterium]
MREILFRGKRTDNREWAYGFYALKGKAYKRQEQHCICVSTLASDCGFSYFVDLEVIPETVGQYTGLTDKNGKKIFEGDIVAEFGEYAYEVKWDVNTANFYLWYVAAESYTDFYEVPAGRLEIIGNIHDNPELLKGGAE